MCAYIANTAACTCTCRVGAPFGLLLTFGLNIGREPVLRVFDLH